MRRLPRGQSEDCQRGVVVAHLVYELRVDVHHVEPDERVEEAIGDEDMVERLGVTVEDVSVSLAGRQRLDQVSEDAALQHPDRGGELEVVEVAEDDDARARVGREYRVHETVDHFRLPIPLRLGGAGGRLEAPEQWLVAALGREVVGDDEQPVTVENELAGEGLAAAREGRVRRVYTSGAGRQTRAAPFTDYGRRRRRASAGPVYEPEPAVAAEEKADPDVAAGLAPVLVVHGVDVAEVVSGASGGADGCEQPPEGLVGVHDRVVLRPVVVLNLLDGDDVGRLQVTDDDLGEPLELRGVVAGVEVLDVEGGDGELVAPGGRRDLSGQAAPARGGRGGHQQFIVPAAVIDDAGN